MTLSIVATGFAFLSTDTPITVGSTSLQLATLLGILTMLTFFLALLDLIVDWRGRAAAHDDATARMADLKGQLRGVTLSDDSVDAGDVDLRASYEHTMSSIVAIPESQFLAMKAKHHRKIALSKLIDVHPGAPLLYLRMLAVLHGLRSDEKAGVLNESELPDEPIEDSPVP
jgi:hypothetical protein